ncbi:MAG: sulfotransferase [Nitrospirota bacterium]|nr:sulfotransferase [Nitrospirota bacterium]
MSAPVADSFTLPIPKAVDLAVEHHHAGRLQDAESIYKQVLKADPNNVDALHLLGVIAYQVNKFDIALEYIQRAISLRNNVPAMHNNLGMVYYKQYLFRQAEDCFRTALTMTPDYVEAINNLGNALKEQGNYEEAEKLYLRALELKPDYSEPYNNLGNIRKERGDFRNAEDFFLRSLECNRDYTLAYLNLSSIKKFSIDNKKLIAQYEEVAAKPGLPDDDLSNLYFALGKIYNDLKEYDEAVVYYEKGNLLERSKYQFDHWQHRRKINRLLEKFSKEMMDGVKSWGNPSDLPIFVVGMPRSGTTLVEQIISSHPRIFGAGELDYWHNLEKEPSLASMSLLTSEKVESYARGYLDRLRSLSPDATHVVDKAIDLFFSVGLIHLTFPKARIIDCRRDPRDTCLSIYFQKFLGYHPYAYDLEDIAFYYEQYQRLMDHWQRVIPPDAILEVNYDRLVQDPENESRKIVEFCNLDWNEQCLQSHKTERSVKTASNWQVRQPIYKSSSSRWKNYEKFIGPLSRLRKDA